MSGCYFIVNKSKSNDEQLYVKIGMSSNIERRYKEICSSYKFNGSNDELKLYQVIECKNFKRMERHLHILFNAYRKIGEYFLLTEDKINEKLMMLNLADYK
jgi:hypothetical protein